MLKYYQHTHNLRTTYLFGIPLFKRIRKVYGECAGGGVFVRYVYKFLNFTYYRTQSVLEPSLQITLINSEWQRRIIEFLLECEDSTYKLLALCKGLDEKSIENVFRILSRLKTHEHITTLTTEEREIRRKLTEEFHPQIFELKKDIFAYNGYFLPIHHFEVGVFYHKHSLQETFSKETLQRIRQKDIIDVGGFIGDSAIIFEREFTERNIYSFEPTSKNYALMQETLRLNNSKRIIPINQGLGSKDEILKIRFYGSASHIDLQGQGEDLESISITTLDEFVRKNKLEVGFIKVDIEGFEQEFLKGARETIESQKPAMLLSIYHNGSDFFDIKPMIESWDLGYRFKIVKPIDYTISIETALFCEVI